MQSQKTMVDLKKILRKAFGKTSLQNEDWLEPSGDMLEKIETRIYTKKKGRGWLFLLPIFLLFLTIAGIWFSVFETSDARIEDEIMASNMIETPDTKTAAPKIISEEITVNDPSYTNKKITTSSDNPLKIEKPIISNKSNHQTRFETSIKTTQQYLETWNPLQDNVVNEPSFFTKLNFKNGLEGSIPNASKKTENNNKPKDLESSITLGSLLALNPLDAPDLTLLTSVPFSMEAPPIKVLLPKKSTWSLQAGTGISYWQFKLNDTYREALDPADFESSNGVGFQTFLGINKQLGSRFSLGAKLAYENIGFSSGHNSTLAYDRAAETETDHSNTKMVAMATPVGFVESDLIINRDSETAGAELLIDIKNRHRIQSLDLQFTLGYSLPAIFGFRPTINAGAGMQYITKITNELKSFTPQQSDFSAGKGAIVTDQNSLQRWSPTITTGFDLEKKLATNLSFGLNVNYLFNLTALQEVGDFSTRINRFNGGVYLRRSF